MSSSASTSSSIARAALQRLLRAGAASPSSSAAAVSWSVCPSLPTTDCATRLTIRDGIGREQQRRDRRARRCRRSGPRRRGRWMKAESCCGSAASRIADTAASLTSTSPPRSASAADIASTISSPVWSGPVPIRNSSAAATAMPSITPPTSSNAWRRRWPCAAARLMTAAIDANAGRGSSSSRIARYHAATAAIAVWKWDSGAVGGDQHCLHRRLWRILEPATRRDPPLPGRGQEVDAVASQRYQPPTPSPPTGSWGGGRARRCARARLDLGCGRRRAAGRSPPARRVGADDGEAVARRRAAVAGARGEHEHVAGGDLERLALRAAELERRAARRRPRAPRARSSGSGGSRTRRRPTSRPSRARRTGRARRRRRRPPRPRGRRHREARVVRDAVAGRRLPGLEARQAACCLAGGTSSVHGRQERRVGAHERNKPPLRRNRCSGT